MHDDAATVASVPAGAVRLKTWALGAYFLLFVLAGVVSLGWLDPKSRFIDLDVLVPGIYSHTSNLVLSAILVLAFGMFRLVSGGRLHETVIFTLVIIACNYGYELLLPLWNVKDPVDAHYGAVGGSVSLAWAAAAHRWGVAPGTVLRSAGRPTR